jgi:flagellin FlaB
MFVSKLHKNESGQAALETAIILIAFVVVASVFAFAILSAGSASTERGEQAIYSGLEGVQSSLELKGAVIAEGASNAVTNVVFTLSTVSGGAPVNIGTTAAPGGDVVLGYRDGAVFDNDVAFSIVWIQSSSPADGLLEEGELAQITVPISNVNPVTTLNASETFSLELKPPTGGVLQINRTTPAAIDAVMELR